MKALLLSLMILTLASGTSAQPAPASTTVPVTLDHNRIIIDVRFPMPGGMKKRVRAWVDNGNPEMWITADLAKTLGLAPSPSSKDAVRPPADIIVGGFTIHPTGIQAAKTVSGRDSIAPGSSAEINLPSTVLRYYDTKVDYLNREFSIAIPGGIQFEGGTQKVVLNPQNGLIQIPSTIGAEKLNLALDLGASWSFLPSVVFDQLKKTHPTWPHMTGAVGSANMWGDPEEAQWELLRIAAMQYGPLTLEGVGVASLPKDGAEWFEKRAGTAAGLIGANALLNYAVGIDYAHSTVYFQQTSKHRPPDMDVIGLVLRPEADGHYTVVGVADYNGKPSVPEAKSGDVLVSIDGTPPTGGTMGETWSLLGGLPGDTRTLVLERGGKQFTVRADVYRFLAENNGKP